MFIAQKANACSRWNLFLIFFRSNVLLKDPGIVTLGKTNQRRTQDPRKHLISNIERLKHVLLHSSPF